MWVKSIKKTGEEMLYFWPRFCCKKNGECKMVESKKMWKRKDEVEEEQDDLPRGTVSGHQRADHPKAYMRQNRGFPALLLVRTLVVRVTELAWEIWYALLVSNNERELCISSVLRHFSQITDQRKVQKNFAKFLLQVNSNRYLELYYSKVFMKMEAS